MYNWLMFAPNFIQIKDAIIHSCPYLNESPLVKGDPWVLHQLLELIIDGTEKHYPEQRNDGITTHYTVSLSIFI